MAEAPEQAEGQTSAVDAPARLEQQVEITEVGPCRKRVRVLIAETELHKRLKEKFDELMPTAQVRGFRPGRAPRQLIEKLYFDEITTSLKGELLLQSLEQLMDEQELLPLSEPDLDPLNIPWPKKGPMEYVFEVEVAPQFPLPHYKGLKLKRQQRTVTDEDVDRYLKRVMARQGLTGETESAGPAEPGDYVVSDLVVEADGQRFQEHTDLRLPVCDRLVFRDGLIENFGEVIAGARAGELRKAAARLGQSEEIDPAWRGKSVDVQFLIKAIRRTVYPDLTDEWVQRHFGFASLEELHQQIRAILEERQQAEQRQQFRQQVTELLTKDATWELPSDLVSRQAQKLFRRQVALLHNMGYAPEEIRARANALAQQALQDTVRILRGQFILQRIADEEKLEVDQKDLDERIAELARQALEPPRRIRARLEREGLMDQLMAEVLEEKVLDLILASAEYEDVAPGKPILVAGVEVSLIPQRSHPAGSTAS
ncbi:MAG: trigger factor [Gemmataceae bacterium]